MRSTMLRLLPAPAAPVPSEAAIEDIRCRAIAAVAATLSDSAPAASGIVATPSQAASASSVRPSRSAPSTSVAGASRSISASRPPPPCATRPSRGAGVASIAASAGGELCRVPIAARTAFGE